MYRQAAYAEHCRVCERDTGERCARCGDPFCEWHVFTDDRVCDACETRWQRVDARVQGGGLSRDAKVGIVVGGAGVLGAMTGNLFIGAVLAFAGLLLAGALSVHERTGRRRRFLNQPRATATATAAPRPRLDGPPPAAIDVAPPDVTTSPSPPAAPPRRSR